MSRKRPNPSDTEDHHIHRSASVQDRSSTFLALYSTNITPKALQADPSIKSASHRILAWRRASPQTSLSQGRRLYDVGHDDDGEKYAGKRLETLLMNMNVEGVVVVARWYGGIMLGPIRFTHIEHVAREAILKSKKTLHEGNADLVAKKPRTEEDDANRIARMALILRQRDQSVQSLRQLLKEKTHALAKLKEAEIQSETGASETKNVQADAPQTENTDNESSADITKEQPLTESLESPRKQIDYSKMPLQALHRLEKARDATIAWILGEITKVEGDLNKLLDSRATVKQDEGQ